MIPVSKEFVGYVYFNGNLSALTKQNSSGFNEK